LAQESFQVHGIAAISTVTVSRRARKSKKGTGQIVLDKRRRILYIL
jgi:hypothetical protein